MIYQCGYTPENVHRAKWPMVLNLLRYHGKYHPICGGNGGQKDESAAPPPTQPRPTPPGPHNPPPPPTLTPAERARHERYGAVQTVQG